VTAIVNQLAFVDINVVDLDAWEGFARDILGFGTIRKGGVLDLRMDERPFRYRLRESTRDGFPILGWQAPDEAAIELLGQRLTGRGLSFSPLDVTRLRDRGAVAGLGFECRNGIRHEVVSGLKPGPAFEPGPAVSGFVTGSGGLGHVVWSIPDVAAMDELLLDVFGMDLREDIATPAGPGHFYGCNPRHHSLAVFSAPSLRLEHLMVEMGEIDDVGCAMDRAEDEGDILMQPLGRHRTDQMISFYVRSPSGFGMEVGCNGLLCGDDWEEVRDSSRKRPWGHGAAMRGHHKTRTNASSAIRKKDA